MSKTHNNILMWSHYADGHKGFCLEFDRNLFESRFYCHQVEYVYNFPSMEDCMKFILDGNFQEVLKLIASYKAKDWEYEKEYRAIIGPDENNKEEWVNNKNRYVPFPPEMLTGVVFGCEMDDKDKNAIRELLKLREEQTPITFYQAKKKDNEFGLEIRKTEWKPDEGWVLLPE